MLSLFGCDPFNTQFESVESAETYRASQPEEATAPVETVSVMTWNIKFGGGRILFFFDCPGDRVIMDAQEVRDHLDGLADAIQQVEPDMLLLQEVDVGSKRSADIDQVQWLLDETHLNHGVYASQWRSSWIPKKGLGHVDSGNAILSRWPFEEATRLALPLIRDQWFFERYFYLKRNILKARQSIPGFGELWVVNTHLSAFSKDGTRRRQVEVLIDTLRELDEAGERFVAGGDFNLIPPGSNQTSDFPDMTCDDYEATDYADKLDVLMPLYESYEPAISLSDYRADNEPYFTFTSDPEGFWNRKLDYLFTNLRFRSDSGRVLQGPKTGIETMPLSDHAPIVGEVAPKQTQQ